MTSSAPRPIKVPKLRAVLIGINQYASEAIQSLDGAVADTVEMRKYLMNDLGVPLSQIKILHDSQATREEIIQAIKNLSSKRDADEHFQEDVDKKGDPFLIYFAGHGAEVKRTTDQELGEQKMRMILPYDYGQRLGDSRVQGIPGYEFNGYLERLSKTQGDNITVILDCCHSGSGTRHGTDNRKVRSSKIEGFIDSRKGTRGSEVAEDFLHMGLMSHVLLAACSPNGKAKEDQGRGEFTSRLLEATIATGGKITYSNLVKLVAIPGQIPQCEGANKSRFLWNSIAINHPHFNVSQRENSFIVEAGFVHGIPKNSEFTIYRKGDDHPSRLIVQSTDLTTSTLVSMSGSGTASTMDTEPHAFVLLRRVGEEGDFRLHIRDTELCQSFREYEEAQKDHHLWNIALGKEGARLALSIEQDYVAFEILNPSVTVFGLHRIPFRVKRTILASVIQCAAHFDWHLRRDVSSEVATFHESVHLEFTKIFKRNGRLEPDKSNLNIKNRIDIVVGKDKYGIKLVNKSDIDLYPYLFFFDCSDLSIKCYYDSPMAKAIEGNAPLLAHGALTIGYSASGWAPWSYSLRQAKSTENELIMHDGQDVDVGFLKLFLSSGPLDLSHLVQCSPFKPSSQPVGRESTTEAYESVDFCETRIIPLVQRMESAEDHGALVQRMEPAEGHGEDSKFSKFWRKWVPCV
ncbi:hypothetical protein M408DRAFT_25451 [Serendipita vermifera MAFF 305830]|uniref:Peptidase C14 caspase domain-containing protein n=1 Tax=Serendipita vermifera MAFF 305830 TaxID=933852 RepID=A0A0C3B424_SERVB|nr:hypothetical protein M408DRAFT_25451 [Serendipita vermifera MAFF 305830]